MKKYLILSVLCPIFDLWKNINVHYEFLIDTDNFFYKDVLKNCLEYYVYKSVENIHVRKRIWKYLINSF